MKTLTLKRKKVEIPKKLQVGTLLYYTYPNGLGHLYFQVIDIKGKFCTVRELQKEVTKRTNGGWDYYTRPVKDNWHPDPTPKEPMRKMIRTSESEHSMGEEYVRVGKGELLFIWNGKDQWNSSLD